MGNNNKKQESKVKKKNESREKKGVGRKRKKIWKIAKLIKGRKEKVCP